MRKILNILFLTVVALGTSVFAFVPKSHAATGMMYVSPASANIQNGATFGVAIRINPGTNVDTVQASLSYSTSYLQLDSMSLGAFTTCTQQTAGGGSVNLTCAMLGSSTSSDSLIANVTFTALAGSGSTDLSLSGNAAYSGAYTNPGTSGGQVSFYTPAAPAPVASSGSSSSGSSKSSYSSYTSAGSASPSAPNQSSPTATAAAPASSSTAPPAIKDKLSVASSKVQFTTASFIVKSAVPAQLTLKYGTLKSDLSSSVQASMDGHIAFPAKALTPGTKYYYQIIAQAGGATIGETPVSTFQTKGFSLSVVILDSHYSPVAGKVVYLHSTPIKAITNSKGIATFSDVPAGYHHIDYRLGNKTYSEPVYVSNDMSDNGGLQTAQPQTDAVILAGLVQPKNYAAAFMTMTTVLLLCLLAALYLLRKTVLHTRLVANFEKFLLNIRKGKFANI
ncbi:MAG TPA: cohesin domain-containing protein [Candidatus Saccharimonadales bacterium]|nr:cohesin domain-containing protein [Candidatus Saccharimonadales bacterium]